MRTGKKVLVLGGTAWLGGEVARAALANGHDVTCLARGKSGRVPDGARLVVADRTAAGAYGAVEDTSWDAVIDISWQPAMVLSALRALGLRAAHWTYVSSCSVYADTAVPGTDENGALVTGLAGDEVGENDYGAAKVACELMATDHVGDRLLIARPGLIGGPGDTSDRTGYWVARAARNPDTPMLVPDTRRMVQVIDVRDLSQWLVAQMEGGTVGVVNTVGPVMSFSEWVSESRRIGGHVGEVVLAAPEWLMHQGVREYMGEDSLSMWIGREGWDGFSTRSGAAAERLGMRHRSRTELLTDLLAWERERGLHRHRKAGLTAARESALLADLARAGGSS